jgi:hypothetical protein
VTRVRPVRALLAAAAADLREPGNALLLLVGAVLALGSALPGFLEYTASADRAGFYDPHYVEHMCMQLGGVLAGTGLRGMLRLVGGLAGLSGRRRGFALAVLGAGTAVDLAAMNPALDLFVDRTPLYHAAEHGLLFVVNAFVGAAWTELVGPSVWAVVVLSAAMLAMVAAGG